MIKSIQIEIYVMTIISHKDCPPARQCLGSYLRDALQEGSADAVACLNTAPRTSLCVFSFFLMDGSHCFSGNQYMIMNYINLTAFVNNNP
jgi:hypothetical protein